MSYGLFYIVGLSLANFLAFSGAVDINFLLQGKKAWVINRALDNYPSSGWGTGRYDSSYNISQQCHNALLVYSAGLTYSQEWAVRMMDSDGEMPGGPAPPGILEGNTHWVGSWEECTNVKATNTSVTLPGYTSQLIHDWDAKQCRCRYGSTVSSSFSFSICMPSTCSEEDVSHLMMSNLTGPVNNTYCGKDLDFTTDAGAITITVILCLFGTIILLATLIDYVRSLDKGHLVTYEEEETNHAYIDPTDIAVQDTAQSQADLIRCDDIPLKLKGDIIDEDSVVGEGIGKSGSASKTLSLSRSIAPTTKTNQAYTDPTDVAVDDTAQNQAELIQCDDIPLKLKGDIMDEDSVVGEGIGGGSTSKSFNLSRSITPNKCFGTINAFSLMRNIPIIVSRRQPEHSYTCIHGINFFTLAWIILGYTWHMGTFTQADLNKPNIENSATMNGMRDRWTHAIINRSDLAIDTFLLLSGCLVTIYLMRQFTKHWRFDDGPLKTAKTVLLNYLGRYCRLTPVYAATLMIYAFYMHYLEQGPLWTRTIADVDNCKDRWWINLLYLNTVFNLDQQCMSWTWYLGNEACFYVIAPLFVFFMFRLPIFGCIFLLLGYAGQLFATSWIYAADPDILDFNMRPWCRFGSYAVGMALGFILFHTESRVKIPKVVALLTWVFAAVFCLLAVYAEAIIDLANCDACLWTQNLIIAYHVLRRDIFALGIAWVVFACSTGYGGIVNRILSWKCLVPLSRLTYAGYLCHPIIISYTLWSRMRTFYIQDSVMVVLYCGLILLVYGAAFVLSLIFEVPILELKKVWLPRR